MPILATNIEWESDGRTDLPKTVTINGLFDLSPYENPSLSDEDLEKIGDCLSYHFGYLHRGFTAEVIEEINTQKTAP